MLLNVCHGDGNKAFIKRFGSAANREAGRLLQPNFWSASANRSLSHTPAHACPDA